MKIVDGLKIDYTELCRQAMHIRREYFNESLITISAVVKRDLQLEKVNYAVVSVTSAQTLKFSEIEGNVAF